MLQLARRRRNVIAKLVPQPARNCRKPNPRRRASHPDLWRPRQTRRRQFPRPPQRYQPLQPAPHARNPPPQRHQQHCQSSVTCCPRRNHGLQVSEDGGKCVHAMQLYIVTRNVKEIIPAFLRERAGVREPAPPTSHRQTPPSRALASRSNRTRQTTPEITAQMPPRLEAAMRLYSLNGSIRPWGSMCVQPSMLFSASNWPKVNQASSRRSCATVSVRSRRRNTPSNSSMVIGGLVRRRCWSLKAFKTTEGATSMRPLTNSSGCTARIRCRTKIASGKSRRLRVIITDARPTMAAASTCRSPGSGSIECVDQRFVVGDHSVIDPRIPCVPKIMQPGNRDLRVIPQNCRNPFVMYLRRPLRLKQAFECQPHEQIA